MRVAAADRPQRPGVDKVAEWLAANVCEKERQADQVREELLAHLKGEQIEPPARDRVRRAGSPGEWRRDAVLGSTRDGGRQRLGQPGPGLTVQTAGDCLGVFVDLDADDLAVSELDDVHPVIVVGEAV